MIDLLSVTDVTTPCMFVAVYLVPMVAIIISTGTDDGSFLFSLATLHNFVEAKQ